MAKKQTKKPTTRSKPAADTPAQTLGWIPQPAAPTIDELVKSGVYSRFGVTRKLLEARAKLQEHMRSPETIERATFERRAGRVGPEMFLGSYIGPRIKNGHITNDMCVVGMVAHKVADRERICKSCRLHDLQDKIGADIDVYPVSRSATADWDIEIPDGIVLQEDRPIRCGTSIGPADGSRPTGTYGAHVLGNDNKQYILSNNHVLAGVSGRVDGVTSLGEATGTVIRHAGSADEGGNSFQIGRLVSPVPMLELSANQQSAPSSNLIDAALAEVDPVGSVQYSFHFFGPIQQKPLPLSSVSPGMMVKKVGRTTGETHGQIIGVDVETPPIGYNVGRNPLTGQMMQAFGRFKGVLMIRSLNGTPFSNRGDSGSLILTETGARPQAVGLLFAGGKSPTGIDVTYAIPIELVFAALGIDRFINDE